MSVMMLDRLQGRGGMERLNQRRRQYSGSVFGMEIMGNYAGNKLFFPAYILKCSPVRQEVIGKTEIAEIPAEQDGISPGQTEPALLLAPQG